MSESKLTEQWTWRLAIAGWAIFCAFFWFHAVRTGWSTIEDLQLALEDDILLPEELQLEAAASEECDEADDSGEPVPYHRAYAIYPLAAELAEIEGEVEIRFVVETDGTTSQIEIVEAQPPDLFDRASLEAVAAWQYCPRAEPYTTSIRLDFTLERPEESP